MRLAVMFSGGKDSTFAIDWALSKGHEIAYLLSVKPSRKDCYLFHYATVEHTTHLAAQLGLKHILVSCDVADPVKEAEIVKNVVAKNPVDAVVFGGVGLQETQIRSVKEALAPLGIQVFPSHGGEDHGELFREMLDKGYEIVITQVASAGLLNWLGKTVTKENFPQLEVDSKKFGFHIGFEGGYADTFVCDGPIFSKRIAFGETQKIVEDDFCGHLEVKNVKLVEKILIK
ncbi:MAG: diphthine--ammonia ligase [archaeon]|nr:diphthine--ammonia ligase [archaeon]